MAWGNQGDIIQAKLFSTLQGQTCLNVFHLQIDPLQAVAPTTNLLQFGQAFAEAFREYVMTSLSTNYVLYRVLLENLTDGLSVTDVAVNEVGSIAQDELPRFNSIGITLRRSSKLTRNGAKRISGLCELQQTNGVLNLTAPQKSNMEFFFGTLGTVIHPDQPTVTYYFNHVIVGRSLVNGKYELDLTKINRVLSASVANRVTTQNTRKA